MMARKMNTRTFPKALLILFLRLMGAKSSRLASLVLAVLSLSVTQVTLAQSFVECQNNSGDQTNLFVDLDVAAGNDIYFVGRPGGVQETITGVSSDVDGAMTVIANIPVVGGSVEHSAWRLFGATSGTHRLTATIDNGATSARLIACEISGGGEIQDSDTATFASDQTPTGPTLTATGAGLRLDSLASAGNPSGISPNGGETEPTNGELERIQIQYEAVGGAGSTNSEHTLGTAVNNSSVISWVVGTAAAGGGEFDTNPSVQTQSASAFTSITGSLDNAGDVYLAACLKDQTPPTGAQVAAGDCTGDVDAEATATTSPSSGNFDFDLSLTPGNCANGSVPCPVYDIYGWDGTNLVTLADEFLDPPSIFGPGADEAGQIQALASVGDGAPVAVFTLDYDNQSANFTTGQILTDGTSGATAYILDGTSMDSGTTGTLVLLKLSGTFANDNEITDDWSLGSGTADVNGSESYYASANDILLACFETNPSDYAMGIDTAGQFTYTGDSSRQSCLNGLLYDVSAEGFLAGDAGDIDYWNHNTIPEASPPFTLAVPIDVAIASIDLSDVITDEDGDTLTFGQNITSPGCSTGPPTGISLMSGIISGTPTVENESGDRHCFYGLDQAGERDHYFLTIPVIDTLAMVDCTTSETAASTCEDAAQATFFSSLSVVYEYETSDTIGIGNVISQDPAASAETELGATFTLTVSSGQGGSGGLSLRNRLRLGL